jgi:3',5'-cyclic AMP phosphodiesterase CpdA
MVQADQYDQDDLEPAVPAKRLAAASCHATLLALFAATGACTAGVGNEPDDAANARDVFDCPEVPVAYTFDYADSDGARAAAERAGFKVQTLPLDSSPRNLRGLILLPSFVSDDAAYAGYMSRYAKDLYAFVDAANIVLELAQHAKSEPSPPFLPTTQSAKRGDTDLDALTIPNPNHALLRGVERAGSMLAWQKAGIATDVFTSQGGFEVVLGAADTRYSALMEGAYGQGRIVLSALALDAKEDAGPARAFSDAFFRNMFAHVRQVCMRHAPAVVPTPPETNSAFTPGSSMLAVLPDTQVYALRLPGLLDLQTGWIANNANHLDIRYVLGLGDITNNNTPLEWERAQHAISKLDGVVHYALVPGNHDYGPSGDASTRDTLFNVYFPYDTVASWDSFGGSFEPDKLDNTYHLFSVGGREIVLIALEWGPRDNVIAWANTVMERYPERDGILITHAYLNNDNLRYDHTDTRHPQEFNPHEYATPGVNDGEELWQKLVRHHGFVMVLNGHVLGDGLGYLASTTDVGTTCHQMLSNYQFRDLGGEDYMRLLEFLPDGHTVRVFTYSPLYDAFLDEPDQNFTITLD